jgi:hypothetical protein
VSALGQRICVLSGLLMIVLFGVGFGVISGFIMPLSPDSGIGEFSKLFAENRNSIRLGLILSMFAGALMVPWSCSIAVQMRRGETKWSPWPHVQMLSSALLSLEFIYLIMFWQVAAFRADTPEWMVRFLYDMGWIPFVGITSTGILISLSMAMSILSDTHAKPVFPRWAGYFNLWVSLCFTPGSVDVFFHRGPFAYNGVLAWYLPVTIYGGIWIPVMTYLTWKAIAAHEAEYEAAGTVAAPVPAV